MGNLVVDVWVAMFSHSLQESYRIPKSTWTWWNEKGSFYSGAEGLATLPWSKIRNSGVSSHIGIGIWCLGVVFNFSPWPSARILNLDSIDTKYCPWGFDSLICLLPTGGTCSSTSLLPYGETCRSTSLLPFGGTCSLDSIIEEKIISERVDD